MYHICRTCFEIIREDVKFYNLENPGSADIVTQLESCIPQLTLNIVKNPVICSSCVETLKVAYNFKVKCLHTEERIYNYILERERSDKEIIDISSVINYEIQNKFNSINRDNSSSVISYEIKNKFSSMDCDNSSVLIKNEFREQTSSGTERDYECGLFLEIDEIEKHETEDLAQSLLDEDIMHQDFLAELGKVSTEDNTNCTPLKIKSTEDKSNDLFHSFSKTVENYDDAENINRKDSDTQGIDSLNILGMETDLVKDDTSNDTLFKLEKQCKLSSGRNRNTKVISKEISMSHCTTVLNNVVNTFHMSLRKSTVEPKYSLCSKTNDKHCDNDSSFTTESNTVSDKTASIKKIDKNSLFILHSCNQCEYATFLKRKLQLHQLTHTEGKHFKCKQCKYSTVWKYCLELHTQKHHTRKHHSYKKPFKCTKCQYKTSVKLNLDFHIRNKQCKNKPFKCQNCEFRGRSKSALQQHQLKHTGEKPFVCSNCDFRSAYKAYVKRHILNTHFEKRKTC